MNARISFFLLAALLPCLTIATPSFGAEDRAPGGNGGESPKESGAGVSAARKDSTQAELAQFSCSGPTLKAEVKGGVLCKLGADGGVKDCDPENVFEPATKKSILNKMLEKVNIEPARQEDLKPEALNTPGHPDASKNIRALNVKLKKLSAKLIYLNSAKNAVHAKVLNPGSANPKDLHKLNQAEDDLGRKLEKTIQECDALQKRIYRDGKRGIVCTDGSKAQN